MSEPTDSRPPGPEYVKRLEKAVARLPRTTREIFLAHRLDGMSYPEIAGRTGLSIREIERHMAKAMYKLCTEFDRKPRRWWERLLGL